MPSAFDILRKEREDVVSNATASLSPFDLLRQEREALSDKNGFKGEDSAGRKAARITKSLGAGATGGLADTVASAYNIPAVTSMKKRGALEAQGLDPEAYAAAESIGGEIPFMPYSGDVPLIPSAVDAIDKKVDEVTEGYTTTPEGEKALHEGLKTMGSVGGMGWQGLLLEKVGQKGLEAVLKTLGSTRPTSIAAAGAAGYATEKAHEKGMSEPAAFGSGIGAALATELAAALFNPKNLAKGAVTAAGFGKGNLKLDALDSAERIGTTLPNAAATSGVLPQLAHSLVSKFPRLGDKIKKDVQAASEGYQKSWDTMLDTVGRKKTPEVKKEISQDYKLMRAAIPEEDTILASDLLDTMTALEKELESTFHSEPTKKLFAVMNDIKKDIVSGQTKLPEGFERFPAHVQEKILEQIKQETMLRPVAVKKLVRQKVELNKFMRDKNIFDRTDTDTLSLTKLLQESTDKVLEEYGAKNPKFLKRYRAANEKYAQTARREELDDLLAGKIRDPNTGEVAYTPLVKILQDKDQQVFLKNNLGDQNYKKLTDFITVAQAMDALKRNNPNPSGTALVTAVIGFVQGLAGSNPLPTLASGLGIYGASKLLTSKRFINKATQFAKEPTDTLAQQIEKIVKEETGVALQTLMKTTREKQEN
jgi:hypothetical protein